MKFATLALVAAASATGKPWAKINKKYGCTQEERN